MARISLISLAVVLVAGFLVQPNEATHDPKTVCYYESWVHWRTGDGKMDPTELDSSMCTHLVYAYFGIEPVTHEIKILDKYLMKDLHDLEKFVNMKGNGKALIAIGGASQSNQFSITASNEFNRDAFVKSVVRFLADNRFDGVMIDWSGITDADSDNLIKLLDKFDEFFASTSYTLAISVPAMVSTLNAYNVPKIVNYVDFINVISLDYAGPWSKTVGHASPFHSQLGTLEEYHKRGAPKHKLVMAVPMYARTWRLAHINKQAIGDEAIGGGHAGPYTQVEGFLSYNELCVMIKSSPNSYSITRDSHETAVYAVKVSGNSAEWISYEDSHTLAAKAKNITEQGYAGMSIYTLSNEDVHGTCGKKNPMLHAINENYFRGDVTEAPFSTISPVTRTTEHVTDIPGVFKCHTTGKFRDPVYCFKYYECIMGDFGLESTIFFCNRTEAFDEATGHCVDRSKIPGC